MNRATTVNIVCFARFSLLACYSIVSTKAEVRFNVHTASWIPEDVRQKIIEKVCSYVKKKLFKQNLILFQFVILKPWRLKTININLKHFETEQKPHQQGRRIVGDLRAEPESAKKPFWLYPEDFCHHSWGQWEATWTNSRRHRTQGHQVLQCRVMDVQNSSPF